MTVTGLCLYKTYSCQQHPETFDAFKILFDSFSPDIIIEVGTGSGGFTIFLDDIKPHETRLLTCDIRRMHDEITRRKIETITDILLEENYLLVKTLLGSHKKPLLLCDGGNKIKEFKMFANYLPVGGVIMCHDFCPTIEYFKENMRDKRWNWCEILGTDIVDDIAANNLKPFMAELFTPIAWGCFQKD